MREKENPKFKYAYLRGFIRENFKTLENYASFLGISPSTLNARLNGNTSFTQVEIYKTANFALDRKLTAAEVDLLFFSF